MNTTDLSQGVSHDPEPISHTTFDRCLVDGDPALTSTLRRGRGRALGLSLVIETALLATIFLLPLMTTVAQPHLVRSCRPPQKKGRR